MGDMSREPSMEEILSSIRRVIARDDAALKPATARQLSPISEADRDEEEDDILELTETEAPPASSMSSEPQDESTSMPASAAPAASFPEPAKPELVSPLSAAASRSSLDVLAAVLASGRENGEPGALPSGDVSVNALVEATLRPMLKQWLDANLPSIVETLVAKEIARITGTRG